MYAQLRPCYLVADQRLDGLARRSFAETAGRRIMSSGQLLMSDWALMPSFVPVI